MTDNPTPEFPTLSWQDRRCAADRVGRAHIAAALCRRLGIATSAEQSADVHGLIVFCLRQRISVDEVCCVMFEAAAAAEERLPTELQRPSEHIAQGVGLAIVHAWTEWA